MATMVMTTTTATIVTTITTMAITARKVLIATMATTATTTTTATIASIAIRIMVAMIATTIMMTIGAIYNGHDNNNSGHDDFEIYSSHDGDYSHKAQRPRRPQQLYMTAATTMATTTIMTVG